MIRVLREGEEFRGSKPSTHHPSSQGLPTYDPHLGLPKRFFPLCPPHMAPSSLLCSH